MYVPGVWVRASFRYYRIIYLLCGMKNDESSDDKYETGVSNPHTSVGMQVLVGFVSAGLSREPFFGRRLL